MSLRILVCCGESEDSSSSLWFSTKVRLVFSKALAAQARHGRPEAKTSIASPLAVEGAGEYVSAAALKGMFSSVGGACSEGEENVSQTDQLLILTSDSAPASSSIISFAHTTASDSDESSYVCAGGGVEKMSARFTYPCQLVTSVKVGTE